MKLEISKGQIVWLQTGNGLLEKTIDKVGSKYFYLKKDYRSKYSIETGLIISEYSHSSKVWLTKEEPMQIIERQKLFEAIKSEFDTYWNCKISLEHLREINKILTTP